MYKCCSINCLIPSSVLCVAIWIFLVFGLFTVDILLVSPLSEVEMTLEMCYQTAWPWGNSRPLDVGHRGMGASYSVWVLQCLLLLFVSVFCGFVYNFQWIRFKMSTTKEYFWLAVCALAVGVCFTLICILFQT